MISTKRAPTILLTSNCSPSSYSAVDCSAGSYKLNRVCTVCPLGTWSKQGDRRCTCCPAGTYAFNHLYCIDCLPGQYSKTSSEVCSSCTAGQVSQAKSFACKTCAAGTYANHMDNRCKKCAFDTYSLGAADLCVPCPYGSYSAMGSKECLRCGSGKYFDKTRRICVKCTTGSSDQPGCTVTAPPSYAPTFASSSSICPAGYQTTQSGSCLKCGWDDYSATPGSTSCQRCKEGYVVNTAHTACRRCPAGYYVGPPILSNPNFIPDRKCSLCPAGSYSYSGSTVCLTECPNDGMPLSDKTGCSEGPPRGTPTTFPSRNPSSAPSPSLSFCSAGQYQDEILNKCIDCSSGYYNDRDPTNPCKQCNQGDYSPPGIASTRCKRCNVGHILNAERSECLECGVNFYSTHVPYNSPTLGECKKCPTSTFSKAGMAYQTAEGVIKNCYYCNRYGPNKEGTGCEGPLTDAAPTSAPTGLNSKCGAGQYEDPILQTCTDCNPGYASPDPTRKCVKCPPGTYGYDDPSSYCEVCPPGSIVNDDSTECNPCPASYYSPYNYLNIDGSVAQCEKCPQGTWSKAGYAFAIFEGVYVNCEPCFYSDVNSDQTGCK